MPGGISQPVASACLCGQWERRVREHREQVEQGLQAQNVIVATLRRCRLQIPASPTVDRRQRW